MRLLLAAFLLFASSAAFAAGDRLVKVDTRPGVTVPVYFMKRDGATATLLLLTGGGGGLGVKDGVPTSKNFLIRSRDLFAAKGFSVAMSGKPTDHDELDGEFRTSAEHLEDLLRVLAFLKKETGQPVWVVGTSMGTISAAALAIAGGGGDLAGVVLTSTVTNRKIGAVPEQKLEAIRVPVLVVHHERDECRLSVPSEAAGIIRMLKNAPVKKEVFVKGGANPTGNTCEALHWHGYIGMEQEVVDLVAAWIKNPAP